MREIPLRAIPSQTFSVILNGQNCQLDVYQKHNGMYVDLYVNNSPIVLSALALDRVFLVRGTYQGFKGDLAFVDTQGKSDPEYNGLANRFKLVYSETGVRPIEFRPGLGDEEQFPEVTVGFINRWASQIYIDCKLGF